MMKPGRYRHYKGHDYEVLGVARHSETEEEYVVYRPLYGAGGLWIRPLEMFLESVTIGGTVVDRVQPELARALHQRHDLSRSQNGFGRHAPPQDAQPSERALIHDGHIGTGVASRSRGGIPGRSSADHHDIVPPFRYVREL